MSSPNRFKRPELDRFEPMRSASGFFGPPRGGAAHRAQPTSAVPGADGVSRGVDQGYRVIEEYMRQGQSFARTLWSPKTAQEAFSTDPQQLAGRMYQYASDFAGAWLEYVQAMMAQVPSAPITQPGTPLGGFGLSTNGTPATRSTGQQAPGPQAPVTQPPTQRTGPLSDTASQVAISVQISSKRRTEVTVDLRPGSLTGALSVLDLRATDGAAGRISSVTAEVSDAGHRVTFRIDVADDQPPGVYMGVVVDDGANLPRGALSVRVFG